MPSASLRSTRFLAIAAAVAIVLATLALSMAAAPPADAAQPAPGHTGLVPSTPRTNTPRISTGEIWDMEVVGQRVFIAGTFTSLQNTTGNTAVVNQRYLASYNYQTGLIDTSFRPTFGGGGVTAVEASPDGTKLYVAGSFNTVNGVTTRKIASISPATGAPVVRLSEAILRLVTPLTVLKDPATYSLVPSGEASTAVTRPPPILGRNEVSIRPVW